MRIGVSLVDNKKIRALNKKYLGRDYATDVLSFNYLDDERGKLRSSRGGSSKKSGASRKPVLDGKLLMSDDYLGDVVVSVEKAKEQAKGYGNTCEQEIAELVAHGVLHLLGVHHKGDDHEDGGGFRKSRKKVQK